MSLTEIKEKLAMLKDKAQIDAMVRGFQGNYLHIRWPAATPNPEEGCLANCLVGSTSGAAEYVGIAETYAYAGPNNIAAKVPKKQKKPGLFGKSAGPAAAADDAALEEALLADEEAIEADPAQFEATKASLDDLMAVRAEGGEDTSQRAFWQGYVAVKKNPETGEDDEIVFVFRGTLRADEWVSNMRGSYLVPYAEEGPLNDVMVHLGFRNIYSEKLAPQDGITLDLSKPTPKEMIEELLYERYIRQGKDIPKITTTGHSLGAALCTMSAFHLANDFAKNPSLPERYRKQLSQPGSITAYPFASPRVGGKTFKKAMEGNPAVKVLRTANDCDIVPRIPLPEWDVLGIAVNTLVGSALAPVQYAPQARAIWDIRIPEGPEISFAWACKMAHEIGNPVSGENAGDMVPAAKGLFGSDSPNLLTGYIHVGKEVRFCSADADQKPAYMRDSLPKDTSGAVQAALFGSHNMELYLHMIGNIAKTPVARDFALLNRSSDLLQPKVAEEHGIAGAWWTPHCALQEKLNQIEDVEPAGWKPNKGLELQAKGPQKVWRRAGWTADAANN